MGHKRERKDPVCGIEKTGAHHHAEAGGNRIDQRGPAAFHIRADGREQNRGRSTEGDPQQKRERGFKTHGARNAQRLDNTDRRGSGLEQSGKERTDQDADHGV